MLKRFRDKNEHGQTMVEFTLIFPVLALLLFGVIQFGIIFNQYLALTDAVRAGARQAAVSRNLSDPEGAVEAKVYAAAPDLDTSKLAVNVSASPGWETGADTTVSATYPYSINLLGKIVWSGDLTSSTTERVE